MMNKLQLLGALLISSCQSIGNSIDSSSYANIDEVITEHIALDFEVDFNRKTFNGNVVLSMLTVADDVSSVFLDSAGLDVHIVELLLPRKETFEGWSPLNFTVTTPNKFLGNAIEVQLPSVLPVNSSFSIRLHYTTNSKSTAINWLTPEQTSGKVLPYLFTQCEDIACRSVAPMQDTPAIKITYESKVKVPKSFVVKMSANETNMVEDHTFRTYYFKNEIKIATYVIAIAVGDLEYRSLGDRVGVVTEPSFMDACVSELENLQMMLDTAESYLTPYIWGNYTILVLPPSFPMGGMENILLTFASPTIITGDKSQVDVATHEIAHSWTGNDVTCENWSNMWLNEGFTVFEERKVSAQIHGVDFSKVASFLGNIAMVDAMNDFGMDSNYSSLFPIVGDNLPDDAFSEIPYEKGF
jgi:leukotriene-A4 hydrolase